MIELYTSEVFFGNALSIAAVVLDHEHNYYTSRCNNVIIINIIQRIFINNNYTNYFNQILCSKSCYKVDSYRMLVTKHMVTFRFGL